MKLKMGSHTFIDVAIPLLWGTRAVLQDRKGRISIIDLSGPISKLEILGDKVAPDVKYRPLSGAAVEIFEGNEALYVFDPAWRSIRGVGLKLPTCYIEPHRIRVGTNVFQNNMISGSAVGINVKMNGAITIGSPMPEGLAKLQL